MDRNYFSILFFIKKSKLLKNGEAPICLRITINGQRAEVQIKRSVEVSHWNSKKECAIGKERKHQELNHYLETVRTKVLRIHRELEQDGKPITAEILKRHFYGENESPKMLLEVFKEFIRQHGQCHVVLLTDMLQHSQHVQRLLITSHKSSERTAFNLNHLFHNAYFLEFSVFSTNTARRTSERR